MILNSLLLTSSPYSPMTASQTGLDTRLSWRVTLLEVTPHCHSPSSILTSRFTIVRLQSPNSMIA